MAETSAPTDAELNQMQRTEMARQIGRIAARLRDAADRLDRHADQLDDVDKAHLLPASTVAADALSEYTALGTNIAPVVWGIVRELGRTQ